MLPVMKKYPLSQTLPILILCCLASIPAPANQAADEMAVVANRFLASLDAGGQYGIAGAWGS
jgi:hypothetical protein